MSKAFAILRIAARAAIWRATPATVALGLPGLVAWVVAGIALAVVEQYLEAWTGGRFQLYGINAAIAWPAVYITVAAFFVRPGNRAAVLSTLVALAILINLVFAGAARLPMLIPGGFEPPAWWSSLETTVALYAAYLIWLTGALNAVLRSFEPRAWHVQVPRAVALCAAIVIGYLFIPHYPVFVGKDFERASANTWELVKALLSEKEDPPKRPRIATARVELLQPALLEKAIARLAPQRSGATDVYAIGVAAWADQDVFVRELDGALAALGKSLPIEGRTLRLVNHPETVDSEPIATRQNLATAVRAVARTMDKDEDVLLLFMTSHGTPDGISLQLFRLAYGDLSPDDVASVLDEEGIRHRIVIVSACYSGVFVKPLASDNSIVLTAADADNSSFGCSNEREWTFFGDAFFNHSLKPGNDLARAFDDAKSLITEWETRGGHKPSNPQGHFGAALMRKLAPVYMSANGASSEEDRRTRSAATPANSPSTGR